MSDLIAVTTWSTKRCHLAEDSELGPSAYGLAGRIGVTLCDPNGNSNTCYDQDAVDDMPRRYSFDRSKPVVITELPPCKRCERAAAKRSVGADT